VLRTAGRGAAADDRRGDQAVTAQNLQVVADGDRRDLANAPGEILHDFVNRGLLAFLEDLQDMLSRLLHALYPRLTACPALCLAES